MNDPISKLGKKKLISLHDMLLVPVYLDKAFQMLVMDQQSDIVAWLRCIENLLSNFLFKIM